MRCLTQPFASRGTSASGAACCPSEKPRHPSSDEAAAMNQASNSRLASTTATGRCGTNAWACCRRLAPSVAGPIVVCIQQDQNPPVAAGLGRRQLQMPGQFCRPLQQAITGYPNGGEDAGRGRARRQPSGDSSQQDRQCGNLAITLDDGGNRRHPNSLNKLACLNACCAMRS